MLSLQLKRSKVEKIILRAVPVYLSPLAELLFWGRHCLLTTSTKENKYVSTLILSGGELRYHCIHGERKEGGQDLRRRHLDLAVPRLRLVRSDVNRREASFCDDQNGERLQLRRRLHFAYKVRSQKTSRSQDRIGPHSLGNPRLEDGSERTPASRRQGPRFGSAQRDPQQLPPAQRGNDHKARNYTKD